MFAEFKDWNVLSVTDHILLSIIENSHDAAKLTLNLICPG